MANWYIFIFLFLSTFSIKAQHLGQLNAFQPDEEYENIFVKKLYSDQHTSTFIVWVKKEVKAHSHQKHTEQVGVLEGKAEMTLGDQTFVVKKGDWIMIPQGTIHAVKVLSKKPVKVISIQTPEFKGKDRVFVKE
ncbi:MAG: cupin domain-containing protein [Flammeovirgaceae bacterium]